MAEQSVGDGGLILTALIGYEGAEPSPGPGFFRLAASKDLIPVEDSPEVGKPWTMNDRQRAFWQSQVDELFDRYAGRGDGE